MNLISFLKKYVLGLSLSIAVVQCGSPNTSNNATDSIIHRGPLKAEMLTGSCEKLCEQTSPTSSGCYCDEGCTIYGDCCLDYRALCKAEIPSAPTNNDPAFNVQKLRKWYLIGNVLSSGNESLEFTVEAPLDVKVIVLWLDQKTVIPLEKIGNTFRLQKSLRDFKAGAHEILLSADGKSTAFYKGNFMLSYPYYVSVTNDWDSSDTKDAALHYEETLHANHAELKMTHFVGPYLFTDPALSSTRMKVLVEWLKKMESKYGDEVGLHIHPYCHFVKAAGVNCRWTPSFRYAQGDSTGYTVILSSYTEDELKTLIQKADSLFGQNGFAKPISFRAGGWTAELNVLKALAANNYLADGSGCNWHRLEEWKDVPGASLYAWNQAHWPLIDDTSQPYYPSVSDISKPGPSSLSVLEVPDNGLLVDYVSATEMIEVFKKNGGGNVLNETKVFSIGFHPTNFSADYLSRMEGALTHVDQFLVSSDKGPVVYVTMGELSKVYQ